MQWECYSVICYAFAVHSPSVRIYLAVSETCSYSYYSRVGTPPILDEA